MDDLLARVVFYQGSLSRRIELLNSGKLTTKTYREGHFVDTSQETIEMLEKLEKLLGDVRSRVLANPDS